MICRLCLSNLSAEIAIPIFNKNGIYTKIEMHKLIAKYIQLHLCIEDPVSTVICQDCCEHLEDFHRFCIQIEQKQHSLQNQQPYEFLAVKCLESDCNEFGHDDNDVHVSANEEEFLELEIDPVCDNSIDSLLPEQKDDIIWEPDDIKEEYEDVTENLTNTTRTKESQRSKQKEQNVLSIEDELPPIEADSALEYLELSCDLCKEYIGNFKDLCDHFETTHNDQQAFIKCCGKRYTQRQSITNHYKRHRSPTKFICPVCSKELCSKINLTVHMKSKHNESNKLTFKCNTCQKEFRSRKTCENHELRHNSKETNQINCDKCKRSFSSTMRLKRHCQTMHEAVYPYKCQACEENFLSKKDVETHQTFCKNRSVLQKSQKASTGTGSICQICCKNFKNLNRLRKHVAFVHENIHPYVCEQCGKKFKFKPAFETHLLQHAGIVEPPAQCNICGKWLKHKNSLRLHLYVHDNAVNNCELCEHVAPTRTALRNHVKKVHRLEREYKCKYCDKSFKDSQSQEEHIATHTGAQLYSCPHCAKETRSRANMYAHIKRMHQQEWMKAKIARSHDPNAKMNLELLTC